MSRYMKTLAAIVLGLTLLTPLFAQDPMQYAVKHITVLAEDDKVRVLRFAPHAGDKTPIHSHPQMFVYVIKGGRIRLTLPDGTSSVTELKTGEVILRAPVTHFDEALDDLEAILVELKK
jgi:quercetin dioxygenase-like cupin family protein